MGAYDDCRDRFCAREASHRVTVHTTRVSDRDYCLDHAAEKLKKHGEVTVRPLRGEGREGDA